MAFCDFVVKHDFETEDDEELTKKILYSVIIKRLKAHKPAVLFIGGDSGEGKSTSALRLMELLLEVQGLKLKDFIHDINVYTPLQYPEKLDALLHSKRLKKVNMICMHEAREVVKAKKWRDFSTQAIADVNAMSRSIKRLCIMIISQFIRDISNDIRYTLNYYMIVRRPKGQRARLYINVLWKDDRDLEKPKLRRRKLSGYIVGKNGRYKRFVPTYLIMKKPDKELVDIFEKADTDAKSIIIRGKIEKLINELKLETQKESAKIDQMIDWYTKDLDSLSIIGKRYRNKWKLKPEVKQMHDLTDKETKEFEIRLNEKVKDFGRKTEDNIDED